ncbi:hypothetical protein [Gynuella sunshinyii]|nr:hypothetical protein [Gynuella sunshinyii]
MSMLIKGKALSLKSLSAFFELHLIAGQIWLNEEHQGTRFAQAISKWFSAREDEKQQRCCAFH